MKTGSSSFFLFKVRKTIPRIGIPKTQKIRRGRPQPNAHFK